MLGRRLLMGAAFASPLAAPAWTRADTYPGKPIRVILPGPVGGVIDVGGRAISERLQQDLG